MLKKNISWLTLLLLFSFSINGCSTKYIKPKLPTLAIVPEISKIKLITDGNGGLNNSNTIKVITYIKKLKKNNLYYRNTIIKYNKFVIEQNNN